MGTKPFSLQSPEQIAKDYGGNKQKIAEAMQLGVIDPTAGTMAAMFIDRMRSAAQTEAAPQQTVAQQAFAPPMPPMPQGASPAGLGATPQAAGMMPPPGAMAPPQGAGLGAPPPPGMAMGGAVTNDMFSAPYMGGGVASLQVPDGMFDEPTNGGYRGGGLVAFNPGGLVTADEEEVELGPEGAVGQIDVVADRAAPTGMRFAAPSRFGDISGNVFANLDTVGEIAPRKTERADEYAAFLERMRSPEEQKKRKQEDLWMTLGQIGAKMATTPGSLLQAAGAGIGEALPGVQAAAKERREEERMAFKSLLDEERTTNKEISERADKALDMLKQYNSLESAFQDMNFRNMWEKMSSADRRYVAQVSAAAGIQSSQISAEASRYGSNLQTEADKLRRDAVIAEGVRDTISSGPGAAGYAAAVRDGRGDQYIADLVRAFGGSGGGGATPTLPAPPPGAVTKVK